jgi:hypothetical protein
MDSDGFYQRSRQLKTGEVLRGAEYGVEFDAHKYELQWRCYWMGGALKRAFAENKSIGFVCPREEHLYAASYGEFRCVEHRRIVIAYSRADINPPDEDANAS